MINFIMTELLNTIIKYVTRKYSSVNFVYNNKNCNEKLLHKLLEYLESYNYPIECFDLHYPVIQCFGSYAKSITPDITIQSGESMKPLAFFKVVDNIETFVNSGFLDEAYHMNKYDKILLHKPYYIVTIKEGSDELCFFNLLRVMNKGDFNAMIEYSEDISTKDPYKYEILLSNERNRLYRKKLITKDKILHIGKIAFYVIVPLGAITLLVLDGLKIYTLSTYRLVVFGIIILCFLIPYLTQVSIKDFSVSFKEDKENK